MADRPDRSDRAGGRRCGGLALDVGPGAAPLAVSGDEGHGGGHRARGGVRAGQHQEVHDRARGGQVDRLGLRVAVGVPPAVGLLGGQDGVDRALGQGHTGRQEGDGQFDPGVEGDLVVGQPLGRGARQVTQGAFVADLEADRQRHPGDEPGRHLGVLDPPGDAAGGVQGGPTLVADLGLDPFQGRPVAPAGLGLGRLGQGQDGVGRAAAGDEAVEATVGTLLAGQPADGGAHGLVGPGGFVARGGHGGGRGAQGHERHGGGGEQSADHRVPSAVAGRIGVPAPLVGDDHRL